MSRDFIEVNKIIYMFYYFNPKDVFKMGKPGNPRRKRRLNASLRIHTLM